MYSDTLEGLKNVNKPLKVKHTDIAWESDVTYKFKNSPGNWQDTQWWDMTNEHFIVWMRTAGLPNFRKLYGSLTNVKAGYYHIEVNN